MAKNDMIIGELGAVVKRLEKLADKLETRLTTVENERAAERGGRKMLMICGAGVSSVFGLVGAFLKDWLPVVKDTMQ